MVVAKKTKKTVKKPKVEPKETKPVHFFQAIGRRKTAVARVRLQIQDSQEISVNRMPLDKYFPNQELQQIAAASLKEMNCLDKFKVTAELKGGGLHAQSEALRHGIARALTRFNEDFRKRLKKAGFLTRDSRMRERKKFGLKRARRAPQWTKR